jgi:hypothetical protein
MAAASRTPAEHASQLVAGHGDKALLLSMRRMAHFVAYCLAYEFEDVVVDVTGADRVDADDEPTLEFSRRAYKLVRAATGSRSLAQKFAPHPSVVGLDKDYELFFPIFNHAHELYTLATVPDWNKRCKKSACFIVEVWPNLLPKYLIELLGQFDHIFIGFQNCVDEIAAISGRPCSYLPLATDVLRFAPPSMDSDRPIGVCNIGRRSPITHDALLQLSAERRMFYYYDTVAASGAGGKQRTFQVDRPSEHRRLLASLLQRSRYYIANRSRVNEPEFTQGTDEISARFYEGAAAGTVMLGVEPNSKGFAEQFDWPDAVIHLPFDSPDIATLLGRFERETERLARIRRDNVANAALRHDWVYRLKTVFDTLGIAPTDAMRERMLRLKTIADTCRPSRARRAG